MPINTDLNVTPYFDDYNEDNNYHRVVFKAATPVQARELTQLQSILQNQVERFGENILVEGTIVKGGNFNEIQKFPYVKILDNNTDDQTVVMENYVGASIVGQNSGVKAIVETYVAGFETQAPDLNTLYVKYTDTGVDGLGNDVKRFLPGEILEFSIDGVVVPELEVAVASLGIDSAPVGNGYGVKCGDGVIFQKGFFVRFDPQIAIVSKYSTAPDGIFLGFYTEEEIINSNSDTSLLDNANGFNNYNAPGADRLKLTPILRSYTTQQAAADENFLAIQEYQNGNLVRKSTDTQFNSVSKLVEQRTSEESGDYALNQFDIQMKPHATDPTKVSAFVGGGVAYVNGKRVENLDYVDVSINKATDFRSIEQQDILANYGNYVDIDDYYGSFDFDRNQTVTLRASEQVATTLVGFTGVGANIGTAKIRSITKQSSTNYRLYIFDVRMVSGRKFSEVRSFTSALGFANVILESGRAVIKDASFNKLSFDIGKQFIKEVDIDGTDYIAKKKLDTTVGTSGTFTITVTGSAAFPYGASATLNSENLNDLIISDIDTGAMYVPTGASTDSNATALTIQLGALPATKNISIVYNVKLTDVRPIGKELATVYMRINPTGDTDGIFHLGWPDVYSIEKIWKGTDTVFTEATPGIADVTSKFSLYRNTRNDFYDISYLKKRSITIGAGDRFLVKAKVFKKVTTGSYSQSFFTVNSYPVDDISTALPVNKIRTENIPGSLRDKIDFRPYTVNNANYATTEGTASIWTTGNKLNAVAFGGAGLNLIAPNKSVEANYSYYLGRKDLIFINRNGRFAVVKGIASDNPVFPNEPKVGMVIAKINIPPFPSLISSMANRAGKQSYGITFSKEGNRRYTMKDIGDIEKRIEKIEYYTVLNALEKAANDMVVTDANGLNRFKNGILVDDFTNMMIADVKDEDFSASVDPAESELAPKIRSYNLDLEVSNVSGVTNKDDSILMLPYNHKNVINQPYATKFRNCVTDLYNYAGTAYIYPEYDGGADVTNAPDVTIDIDLASPFIEFTESLSEFVPLSTADRNVISTRFAETTNVTTTQLSSSTSTETTTTDTSFLDRTTIDSSKLKLSSERSDTKIGEFVSNVQFNPFLRSKILRIFATGLRPNTRFYFFFDGQDVMDHVAKASLTGSDIKTMKRTSAFGLTNPIRSDANGELSVMFKIPENTFHVGDRDFTIIDVNSLSSEEASTSAAVITYSGYNFSIEKTGLEVSTRTPSFDIVKTRNVMREVRVERDVTSRNIVSWDSNSDNQGGGVDPIAQTFTIDTSHSDDSHVMITKIAVAFENKDSTRGVTLEVRNVVNGYPGAKRLPFGRVKLRASDVVTSVDGSALTSFVFKSPIALKTGEEYCFVILPDANNPNYRIWVAKTGQADVVTGVNITRDVNGGTLFTSTNNKAWTPYQDENVKFLVSRANYTGASGSARLSNKKHEFFDLASYSAKFQGGEKVFKVNANGAGSLTTEIGSNIIIGTGTAFNTYLTVGDYIAYHDTASTYEVAKVTAINSNTSITVDEFAKVSKVNRTYFKTIVGDLTYLNIREPVRMVLENSSAKTGAVFAAGDIIRGEVSESMAEIASVINLPVSYLQPNIYKTNFTKTETAINLSVQSSDADRLTAIRPLVFNDNNYMSNINTVIKSRTNEILDDAGAKSFELRVDLENISGINGETSPIIDHEISSITTFEYFTNALTTDIINSELRTNGLSNSKYISKVVELADGFDAEDLKIWVTAYRPPGTDITVYAKFKSVSDTTPITDVPWTIMELNASKNYTSSAANRSDFKEFEFSMNSVELAANMGAYQTPSGFEYKAADGSVYDNYKFFAVKILLNSNGQRTIPRLKDMRAIALT